MSFSVTPASDPYATPLVAEPQSATDRRRARDDANRRRRPHSHAETARGDDPAPATPDADAVPPIGTLIDVLA